MKAVRRIRYFLLKGLWTANLASLSTPRRILYLVLRAVALAIRGFHRHRASIWASSLTYVSLLSLVPFLALVVMIGASFGVSGKVVDSVAEQIPPNQLEVIENTVEAMESMDFRAIGAVALLLLMFAVVRTLTRIENAFNEMWGVSHGRSFGRRLVNYVAVSVLAPLFVLAAMALSAGVLSSKVVGEIEKATVGGWVLDFAIVLIPFFATLIALTLMYWLMPNTRIRFSASLLGAFVASILWMVLQKAYFHAQVELSGFGAVYGAFAALPMFLIWMYFSWLLVLLGGEISYGAQHASAYAHERGEVTLSQESKERTALRITMLMAAQFETGEAPLDSDGISLRLGIPARLTNRILSVLHNQKLVSNLLTGEYQIARSPSRITAADIVRGLRVDGEALPANVDEPAGALERIAAIRNEALAPMEVTLADLVNGTTLSPPGSDVPWDNGADEEDRGEGDMRVIPLSIAILIIGVGVYFGMRPDSGDDKPDGGDAQGDLVVGPDAGTGGQEVPPEPDRRSGGESRPGTAEESTGEVGREESSPPEAPAAKPEPERPIVEKPGPMELLKQAKVTLQLDNETALVVLASIASEAGVRIDMDKDLQETLGKAPVTLSLAECTGDTALDLVLMLAGPEFTYSEKDGKIVIHKKK